MTNQSEETFCATCSAPISVEEWHPAATERTDHGDTVIRSFCSRECRQQWTEAVAEGDGNTRAQPLTDDSQRGKGE